MELRENPFSLKKKEKDLLMTEQLAALTEYHRSRCREYRNILKGSGYEKQNVRHFSQLPYLPVSLFKSLSLSSVPKETDLKVMTSSGTISQEKSQVILDPETRLRQQQVLASIGSSFLGTQRMPMLVIDCPKTAKADKTLSARTSGIRGFSLFGTRRVFALRDDMTLDEAAVLDFLEKYGKERFLIFGFTFLVWKFFCLELERREMYLDCSQGILVHGGGWKRLASEAVSKEEFKRRLKRTCGLCRIHDYYGMAEQAGSIFFECEHGHLHCSDYSAVLFRRPEDLSLCKVGEKGLIQVLSLIPKSYPGHSLLTEDEGCLLGEDDCPCGRAGVYFQVLGRSRHAQLRGCSDTFEEEGGRQEERAWTPLEKLGQTVSPEHAARWEHGAAREHAAHREHGAFQEHAVYRGNTPSQSCDPLEEISYLVGSAQDVGQMREKKPLEPFSEETLSFLGALSKKLLEEKSALRMPEVAAFAFWCRRAHLEQLKSEYGVGKAGQLDACRQKNQIWRLGRGVSLHFVPSNLPALFAFSMAAGLLAGNSVLMRLPQKETLQEKRIVQALRELLETEFRRFQGRIVLCRYGHGVESTCALSKLCDVRVIWGSDASVLKIRKSPLPPNALDLSFASRESLAVLSAKSVCSTGRLDRLVQDFYNDTYQNDQNACSSPRMVYWLGDSRLVAEAKGRFWKGMGEFLEKKQYGISGTAVVQKLEKAQRMAATFENSRIFWQDGRIVRVQVEKLKKEMWNTTAPCGFFIEGQGESLEGTLDIFTGYCQTAAVYGVDQEELANLLVANRIPGVDRIVPVGHTLDFSLVWDGVDLIEIMSKRKEVGRNV